MDAALSARHKLKLRKWSRNMQLGQSSCVQREEKHSAGLSRAFAQLPWCTTGSLVSTAGCEAPDPWVPAMQGPETGCHAWSGHVYWEMRFLPSFSPVFSLCYPIDASQALHLVLRISQLCLQTDAQEFWALLSLALAAWLNGTGHHPVSLAISVPSACFGLAPHSSYAPSHLLGSNAE